VTNLNQFIALGDSLTEGLSDKYPDGSYRGWADRVADEMSRHDSSFRYANLAVRGKLIEQVVSEQLAAALPWIQGQQTLVTFHAGANNVLRPKFEPAQVFETYQNAVAQIAATGAKLLLFTVREISDPQTKTQHYWNQRFGPFNENVKRVAQLHGATVMDANSQEVFGDPRMLAADRLHLSPEGHRRVAAAILKTIELPHDDDWKDAMPPYRPIPAPLRAIGSVVWGVGFLVPWAVRRVTGKSSGDNRVAKYPVPTSWPTNK
jgi:lysophospholipase L1-like esterase